jgi:hypothetical protein
MLIILTKEWVHNEAKNDANSTIVLPMLLNMCGSFSPKWKHICLSILQNKIEYALNF